MEIIEVNWGCANTYRNPDRIEINEKLNEFPELRKKVILHEKEHLNSKGFFHNRKVDYLDDLKFRELLPFYKKYPKHFFQQYCPLTYKDNTLYFEWSLIILYTIYILLGSFIYWIIKTFSKDSRMFWNIIWYSFLILMISALIYFGAKAIIKSINEQANKEVK